MVTYVTCLGEVFFSGKQTFDSLFLDIDGLEFSLFNYYKAYILTSLAEWEFIKLLFSDYHD